MKRLKRSKIHILNNIHNNIIIWIHVRAKCKWAKASLLCLKLRNNHSGAAAVVGEMWSGSSDLSAVSMASLMHHLCADYYTPNSERESEWVGEIYLFVLKEWRGGFMSYQSSCLFSAWWIMVRYLLILWKEEWRQSVTSFLSDCGYTRQPSSFTAPLPDATDADEIWQREVFVQNLAQKYTGRSVSPGPFA